MAAALVRCAALTTGGARRAAARGGVGSRASTLMELLVKALGSMTARIDAMAAGGGWVRQGGWALRCAKE